MLSIFEYGGYEIRLINRYDYTAIFVYIDNDEIYHARHNYKFGQESSVDLFYATIEYITKKKFDNKYCKLIERKLI